VLDSLLTTSIILHVEEEKRVTPPPHRFNFAAHVLALAAARPDAHAYRDDGGALSYGDLATRVRACAGALLALGLRPEERVLLLAHDTCEWPVAFLGALYAGVVPVAVNTLLTVDDYAYMLEHSRARAAIVSSTLVPTLDAAKARAAHALAATLTCGESGDGNGTASLAARIARAKPPAKPADTRADDIAFWLYSSGSTGRPKGAVHTHGNLWWTQATYGEDVLGLTSDDTVFSAAKLFFAYGLGNALTFPLSAGATTLLMAERPTPQAVWKRVVDAQPTVFFGVPTLFAAMLAAPDRPPREATRLRVCVSAGEALPKALGERFRDAYGVDILDGIGSTEMLHIFLSNRPGDVRYGSTGKPVAGYDIELRREDGRPALDGEIGDLWVRGQSAALCYWADRERSRATFAGAWTKSGDKYVRDGDGYYTYAGRVDDMLKVSGQYVSPFEVEAALAAHAAVLEAAVIGVADAEGLTRAKACVVVRPGVEAGDALADELRTFVKDRLAPFKYPRVIEFMAELPKTATGKIQRFRLREREARGAR
jgi:benzoate-CoA ligase